MVREVLGVLYVLGVLNALGIIKILNVLGVPGFLKVWGYWIFWRFWGFLKVLGGARHFKGSGDSGDDSVRWDAAECVLECLCRKLTEGS